MFTFIHYTLHKLQKVNYTKWQSSVCRCAMLCYHNIDHLWHGKIYTNTITQKRIPCAGAQCCAVTILTTSDMEKVQKCHPVQWLTATQNIHFWVPVIVKFSHYRYKLPLYRVIPGTRAAWEAPQAREPAPKRPRSLGFFLQRGLTRPWPLFQGTRVISHGLGSPLTYITNTTYSS